MIFHYGRDSVERPFEDNSSRNTEPPDSSDLFDVNEQDTAKPYDETITLLKEYLEKLSVSLPEIDATRVLIEEGEC